VDEQDPVTPGGLRLAPVCLSWKFSKSGGPGGQHVNTTESRVELRCDLPAAGLEEYLLTRIAAALGEDIRVTCSSSRSQRKNRAEALDRLALQLDVAAKPVRARRATRPSKGAKERRLEDKRQSSGRKADRRWKPEE
jgi:ribosome-associated protein